MDKYSFKRIPNHLGIIPDGNRRWATEQGLENIEGYKNGIEPAKRLYEESMKLGINEITVYCFTHENIHRPKSQIIAFTDALIDFVEWAKKQDISLLIVGNRDSKVFPKELLKYTTPTKDRNSKRKLNLLVNYSWKWDIKEIGKQFFHTDDIISSIGSISISKIDLILRWGNRSRLSGFVPLQSAYADIYIIKEMFPGSTIDHLHQALEWYQKQDITMGG